jgi:hypothetical protein
MTTAQRSATFGFAALAALVGMTGDVQADDARFGLDIAADCNRFITEGNGHLAANPKFGDYFMQEGVIYRPGTFERHCPGGDGCGLLPDGTPQFPNAVIGKWTCYGSFVGNGIATEAGVWLYSTQVYEFDVEELAENVYTHGRHLITSHGPERIDEDVPWFRAVTGGTGKFQHVTGEVQQTKIGFNQTQCENFTFEFKLASSDRPRR